MKKLPSHFHTLPAEHHRNGKMKALLRDHGASGPHAFTVLLGEAASGTHGRGVVKMNWDEFCLYADVADEEAARARLREMEDYRLIAAVATTRFGFSLTLPNWDEWDLRVKDPTAAARQRRHRAKTP